MPHVVTSPAAVSAGRDGETGVERKRRPMWNSKTKRINFGRTTRRIQIWVQAGFQSLLDWPVWFFTFLGVVPLAVEHLARWLLATTNLIYSLDLAQVAMLQNCRHRARYKWKTDLTLTLEIAPAAILQNGHNCARFEWNKSLNRR